MICATPALPEPGPAAATPRAFIGLDLIRFVAALMVAFHHLGARYWRPDLNLAGSATPPPTWFVFELWRWGWVGVEVFFVISGFVIAYSLQGRTASQFVTSRFLRLYPAAWICATLSLLLGRWGEPGAWADYGRSMLLSPIGPWIDFVYWTLAVEIVFYLAVAVFRALGLRLIVLARGLTLASALYWFGRAIDFTTGGTYAAAFRLLDTSIGNLTLIPYGCFFALGIFLWSWKFEGRSVAKAVYAVFAVASGALGIFALGRYFCSDYPCDAPWRSIEPVLIWLLALLAILVSTLQAERVWAALGLLARELRLLGLATYPLYLLHEKIGIAWLRALGGGLRALGIVFGGVIVLSFAVVAVENRLRKLLVRLLAKSSRPPLPAASLP